jgi:hypothetical protein
MLKYNKYNYSDQVKEAEMGRPCSTNRKKLNACSILQESQNERD